MAAPWLISGKLAPPVRPDDWLPRALAAADADAAATLLLAGPGYGKTLGLLALADRAPAGTPVLWLGLDEADAEAATFFRYLLDGMRAHVPPFGEGLETLLAARRLAPKLLWQQFFGELAAYNLPDFRLVLDDAHLLLDDAGGQAIVRALVEVLDRLPPGARVLVASRRPLPGVARAIAARRLHVVPQADLAFSPSEARDFAARRLGEAAATPAWQQQLERLDGWPLGLALATAARGAAAAPVAAEALEGYIAEELYATRDAASRDFMLQAALLHEPSPEACRRVFGCPDAESRLAELEATHLVTRLAGEGGPLYRMAGYLRAFLEAEARRTWPFDVRADWHRRAAAYYEAAGRDDLAVPHRLAAEDWPAAAAACGRCFPALRFGGQEARIARWLDAFPREVEAGDATLSTWRGHLHVSQGRPREADAAYARAEALAGAADDAATLFKVGVRRAILAVREGDGPRANRLMLQALARVPDGVEEDLADLHLARAMAADQRGDLALMAECNAAVLAVPVVDNVEIATSHALASLNLHTHALHRGELAAAREHLERARAIAEAWRLYPTRLFATFLAANLHLVEGEVAAAGALIAGLPADWRDLMDWQYEAIALIIVGHHRQRVDDWRGADEALARAMAVFERGGYAEGRKLPLERLMWGALERGQWDRLFALRAEVGELDGSIYDLALALPYARGLALAGRADEALAVLDAAIPALEGLEAGLHLARARLFEAAAAREVGDTARAEAAWRLATEAIARHGYDFLRREDPRLWPAAARAPETPGGLEIRALGGFEVRVDGGTLAHWPRRKAKAVLAALLLYPQGLPLPTLASLLGADEGPAAVRRNVSALRQQLEPGLGAHATSRFVALEDERYRLRPEAVGFVDVRAFDAAVVAGDALREREPVAAAARYDEAIALYRGELCDDGPLGGLFEPEREAYRRRAVDTLGWLAGYHRARGDFSAERAALERAVAIAPCEEPLYLALMEHHLRQGRPERVRPLYWDCRKALKLHLGLAPGEDFERAVAALSRG